jgi:hypothetical protein
VKRVAVHAVCDENFDEAYEVLEACGFEVDRLFGAPGPERDAWAFARLAESYDLHGRLARAAKSLLAGRQLSSEVSSLLYARCNVRNLFGFLRAAYGAAPLLGDADRRHEYNNLLAQARTWREIAKEAQKKLERARVENRALLAEAFAVSREAGGTLVLTRRGGAPRTTQKASSVTRQQFRDDPRAAVEQAVREGRVDITDAQGRAVAAISVPTDKRPVRFDDSPDECVEREKIAAALEHSQAEVRALQSQLAEAHAASHERCTRSQTSLSQAELAQALAEAERDEVTNAAARQIRSLNAQLFALRSAIDAHLHEADAEAAGGVRASLEGYLPGVDGDEARITALVGEKSA